MKSINLSLYLSKIINAHGLLDQSPPPSRPHCSERVRQKQVYFAIDGLCLIFPLRSKNMN